MVTLPSRLLSCAALVSVALSLFGCTTTRHVLLATDCPARSKGSEITVLEETKIPAYETVASRSLVGVAILPTYASQGVALDLARSLGGTAIRKIAGVDTTGYQFYVRAFTDSTGRTLSSESDVFYGTVARWFWEIYSDPTGDCAPGGQLAGSYDPGLMMKKAVEMQDTPERKGERTMNYIRYGALAGIGLFILGAATVGG